MAGHPAGAQGPGADLRRRPALPRRGLDRSSAAAPTWPTPSACARRRAKHDPKVALDYYLGTKALAPDPARGGALTASARPGTGDAQWRPLLTEKDLAFEADWGFEAYAGDADRMIALIKQKSGSHNVFLAGHSQGGAFVSNYAGRLQARRRKRVATTSWRG